MSSTTEPRTVLWRRFEDGYRLHDVAGLLIGAGFDLVDVLEAPRGPDGCGAGSS